MAVKLVSSLTVIIMLVFSIHNSQCLAFSSKVEDDHSYTDDESADIKSEINLEIARNLRYVNFDSSMVYAYKAIYYAQLSDNIPMTIKALNMIAALNNNIGNSEEALELYNEAKDLCMKSSNYELLTFTYLNLSSYYNSKFNYYKVIEILDSALLTSSKYNINTLKYRVYQRIGSLYYKINDISLAEYYSDLAEQELESSDDIEIKINNIHLQANIAFKKNDPKKALKIMLHGLEVAKESGNVKSIQLSYRRIAAYYMDIKDYNTSNIYIDSSLVLTNELGFKIERSSLITYKAHLHSEQNDYKGALKYNLEAYKIRKETGHRAAICSSLLNIGGNYTKLKDYDKAFDYINRGLEMAKKQKILSFVSLGYAKLSQLNRQLGNYKEALNYYELQTTYTDSVLMKRTNEKVLFFSNLLDSEREKRQIDTIELQRKTNNIILLIVGTILSSVMIMLLFRINYVRRKKNKEISKLSKVIETTDQAVIITSTDGTINYVNNGFLKLLGYNDKNEVSTNILNLTDDDGKKTISNVTVPKLRSENNWRGEANVIKKDGTSIIAELICSTLKDENNNPELFVTIFSDITRRKKNELDLEMSRENLKKTVETQDRMFSIIAHDLTGPFTTILGFSKMLCEDYFKYNEKGHLRFSRIINQSSKQTYDLLTNLLHWSRSQMGKIEIDKETTNLFGIVDENLSLFKHSLKNKEIKLTNKINPDTIIFADTATISIVLRNLLSNAIKFTPRGGEIKVSEKTENGQTIISVCDSGVGISSDALKNLFNSANSNSTIGTENEKGTGLGLMLCSDLVRYHDGSIKVESSLGNGTCFHISLPAENS